jgi:hypothetical protein
VTLISMILLWIITNLSRFDYTHTKDDNSTLSKRSLTLKRRCEGIWITLWTIRPGQNMFYWPCVFLVILSRLLRQRWISTLGGRNRWTIRFSGPRHIPLLWLLWRKPSPHQGYSPRKRSIGISLLQLLLLLSERHLDLQVYWSVDFTLRRSMDIDIEARTNGGIIWRPNEPSCWGGVLCFKNGLVSVY